MNLKSEFDVVIIGAGIAGLECAKQLGNNNYKVLLVERNNYVGRKVCANAITSEDFRYIPSKYINFKLKALLIFCTSLSNLSAKIFCKNHYLSISYMIKNQL